MTTIPTLPTAPDRNDPATFPDRANAWVAAIAAWTVAVNQVASEVTTLATGALNSPSTISTSTTSLAVGTGVKVAGIQTGKAWVPGQWALIIRTSSSSVWMAGQVTAYDSGSGSFSVDVGYSSGSGTFSDWTIAPTQPAPLFPATAAQMIAGVSSNVAMTPASLIASMAPTVLTYGASIPVNLSSGYNFLVTLAGNGTLATPTGLRDGQSGFIFTLQNGTGGWQLAYASGYDLGADGTPILPSTPNALGILGYVVKSGVVYINQVR